MKKPFQLGERVRVYATVAGGPIHTAGTVNEIDGLGMLRVDFDKKSSIGNYQTWAHPKQLRRLVKKKKLKFDFAAVGEFVEQNPITQAKKSKRLTLWQAICRYPSGGYFLGAVWPTREMAMNSSGAIGCVPIEVEGK